MGWLCSVCFESLCLCFFVSFVISSFFKKPPRIRKTKRGEQIHAKGFFCVYFVQLFTDGGRGRARGWRDARPGKKKGARESVVRFLERGVLLGATSAALPKAPPPKKEKKTPTTSPPIQGERGSNQNQHGSTQTTTEYKVYVFFYKKTGGEQEGKRGRKSSFPRFPPFPLSCSRTLARSNLFPPDSLSLFPSLSIKTLSLSLSVSVSLSLSRVIKNTGVVL